MGLMATQQAPHLCNSNYPNNLITSYCRVYSRLTNLLSYLDLFCPCKVGRVRTITPLPSPPWKLERVTFQRPCVITNQASYTTSCQADLGWGREPCWEVAISLPFTPSVWVCLVCPFMEVLWGLSWSPLGSRDSLCRPLYFSKALYYQLISVDSPEGQMFLLPAQRKALWEAYVWAVGKPVSWIPVWVESWCHLGQVTYILWPQFPPLHNGDINTYLRGQLEGSVMWYL